MPSHQPLLFLALLLSGAHDADSYTSAELAAMPKGGAPCTTTDPFRCWGNGDCTASRCVCLAGWTGENCTTLDLAPAPPSGAIRRKGWSTWGGSPIRAEDGKIHVFASQFANHCPLGNWQNNSLVIHAIASEVVGPYEVQPELVLPPFHHNPSVQRAPDGTYTITCIGSAAGSCPDGPSSNCTGKTIKHCASPDETVAAAPMPSVVDLHVAAAGLDGSIHMASSKSLWGPWEAKEVLAGRPGRWDEQTTNPAPHVLKNGTALLVYRGVNGLGTDRIGAARATSWDAKYERVADEPLFGRCGNWTSSRDSATKPAETGCSPVHNWTKLLGGRRPEWDYVCDDCIGWAEE